MIDHLKELFTDGHSLTETQQKLNRKVFRKILSTEAIEELENPKSQVRNNKTPYLKACKVYSLRCIRKELMNRNQTKWFLDRDLNKKWINFYHHLWLLIFCLERYDLSSIPTSQLNYFVFLCAWLLWLTPSRNLLFFWQ